MSIGLENKLTFVVDISVNKKIKYKFNYMKNLNLKILDITT